MRILFVGGMYRGFRLAERLVARGENVVGAFVYEEDPHESPKFCDRIEALLASQDVWCKKCRRIASRQLADLTGRLRPDVILCMGWRTIIPSSILAAIPRGGVAVHDSLLPRLRGFAPTNWGMILGHDRLGTTLFQLTDEMDAGVVYFQESIVPSQHDSYASIQERIADSSVRLFDQFLDAARAGTLSSRAQNEDAATYTCARTPIDGEIDWHSSGQSIERMVRALGFPGPGAFTFYRGLKLSIVAAQSVANPRIFEGRIAGRIADRDSAAGTVDVLCGEGMLRIARVQLGADAETTAATVLQSVRESLGMNYSLEISTLRTRIDELELLLRRERVGGVVGQQGSR